MMNPILPLEEVGLEDTSQLEEGRKAMQEVKPLEEEREDLMTEDLSSVVASMETVETARGIEHMRRQIGLQPVDLNTEGVNIEAAKEEMRHTRS